MENNRIKLITSGSLVAAALSLSSPVRAANLKSASSNRYDTTATQNASTYTKHGNTSESDMGPSSMSRLRVATERDANCQASKYDDAKIVGSDNQELGHLHDFLIDPEVGKVRFAVVSSGGWAGIGDKLHVVPFTALKVVTRGSNQNSDKREFTVDLSKAKWDSTPTINEDKFEEGRVTLDSQMQQQVAQAFSTNVRGAPGTTLLRASKIRGRDVMANGQNIGSIEGVVLMPGHASAMALLDPANDFAGSNQKFVVPLTKLQIANVGSGDANTSLTRDDFRSAATASSESTMGTTSGTTISPTGSTSGFGTNSWTNSGNAASGRHTGATSSSTGSTKS